MIDTMVTILKVLGLGALYIVLMLFVSAVACVFLGVYRSLAQADQRARARVGLDRTTAAFAELDRAEAAERAQASNPFLPEDRLEQEAALRRTYDPTGEWEERTPIYEECQDERINTRGGLA